MLFRIERLRTYSEANSWEMVARGFVFYGFVFRDEIDASSASSDEACQSGVDITILSITSEFTLPFV